MLNPINAMLTVITAIIDIAEPAIEDDDTVEFQPVEFIPEPEPVLCTRPIELSELHDLNQLAGGLFAYRLDKSSAWQTGYILSITDDRFGYKVMFQPKDRNLTAKIRPMNEIYHAWWEVAK